MIFTVEADPEVVAVEFGEFADPEVGEGAPVSTPVETRIQTTIQGKTDRQ